MKKLLLISGIFILSTIYTFAQDIILKEDGSETKAKVLEITDRQIKYQNFDFKNEPIRTINISDVFMITYENGKKEVFNRQTSTPILPKKGNNNNNDRVLNDSIHFKLRGNGQNLGCKLI